MRKRIRIHAGWIWVIALSAPALPGCALTGPRALEPKPMLFPAVPATVFIADGAGNFQMTSKHVRNLLETDGYPIEAITFEWSHGNYRIVADQTDYQYARWQGEQLAALVEQHHAEHPERPIYLMGHSAGGMIVLAALEHVSPGVVERALLLSPSVSSRYDLCPALQAVKQDLHVFYSKRDTCYLGMYMRILGTSDRLKIAPAAGRVGFRPRPAMEDPDLMCKLVQHRWVPEERSLGHNGGHFGAYQPDFLRLQIVPLLNPHPGHP